MDQFDTADCQRAHHYIGNGRYAHFRRDRRYAQVQVAFTAPEGVDPNRAVN